MNILQVTAALEQGGVERGTVEMAHFIVSQRAGSFVASQGGRLVGDLIEQGSTHLKLPLAKRNPLTIIYSAFRLCCYIRKNDISLVHARSRAPAWAALIACKITRVPFVTTFHGTHRLQNRLKKFYNSVMTRGRRVIAVSQFIRQHIIDNYCIDEALIDVAPRGFDPERINPDWVSMNEIVELRQALKLEDNVPVVLLPGRLTRLKGQTLFLQALSQIKEMPWQAVIVGGAGRKRAYIDELKQMAGTLGIKDRIVFAGNQADIAPYYALAALVVSASTEPEAFGRVAVEGQAMGVPVIASAHGGALETVRDGETGWLFRNRDSGDLADKLSHALGGTVNLEEVGSLGRLWVEENYTINKMCQTEWSVYSKVLDR